MLRETTSRGLCELVCPSRTSSVLKTELGNRVFLEPCLKRSRSSVSVSKNIGCLRSIFALSIAGLRQ